MGHPGTVNATGSTALERLDAVRSDLAEVRLPLPLDGALESQQAASSAAHAMTPDLGQGGGQAMEDAATLAALLGALAASPSPDSTRLDHALSEYDRLRRRRTQPIAKRARAVGALAHTRSRIGVALRDGVLRLTPDFATAAQLRSIQEWEPPIAA